MKNKIKFTFATLVFIFAMMSSAFAVTTSSKELDPDAKISRQQMEAQIYFFNNVLMEFAATSPDEAVTLWVKGDKTRNGVYKYAVACDSLKQQLISDWGIPEKSYWIIGGSSPWLTGYDIISRSNITQSEFKYIVQYQWATSGGPEAPSTEQLLVKKINDKWCISQVVQSDGYYS